MGNSEPAAEVAARADPASPILPPRKGLPGKPRPVLPSEEASSPPDALSISFWTVPKKGGRQPRGVAPALSVCVKCLLIKQEGCRSVKGERSLSPASALMENTDFQPEEPVTPRMCLCN